VWGRAVRKLIALDYKIRFNSFTR